MQRRVVVTGVGLITPVGNSVEATWSALMQGRSGVDYIKKFDVEKFPVKFAAEVKDFDPLDYVEKKEARKMGAFIHYAIAASDEAIKDSGLQITEENAEQVGTYISSGIGDFWAIEREHSKLLDEGPRPRFALLHPVGHRQSGRGPGLHTPQGEGAELRDGDRLRGGRSRHRR